MIAKIQKWGNSQGIRIPKSILETAHFSTDEDLDIKAVDGKIILEPAHIHKTLKERFKNYDGDYQCSEWDTGKAVGREVF
jgi:antitoxin MazE